MLCFGHTAANILKNCSTFSFDMQQSKIKGTTDLQLFGTAHPVTRRHVHNDQNPQQHHCQNLKCCMQWTVGMTSQSSNQTAFNVIQLKWCGFTFTTTALLFQCAVSYV